MASLELPSRDEEVRGPSEEFEDPTRIRLIAKLEEHLKTKTNGRISTTSWAILWLSDVDKLNEFVQESTDAELLHAYLAYKPDQNADIVGKCAFFLLLFLWRRSSNADLQGLLVFASGKVLLVALRHLLHCLLLHFMMGRPHLFSL